FEAPGIEADHDIVSERVGAGEIEIDQAGQLVAEEEHVVRKQVGMDDAARQVARPGLFEELEPRGDPGAQPWLHAVGARAAALVWRAPALDRERVPAGELEAVAGEVESRERLAERGAMGEARPPDPHAVEKGDDRGRPPGELAERLARAVLDR